MAAGFCVFTASFFAALVSGSAGFGGALLLLPVLVLAVGPVQAVPLLTVAQFVGNFSRVAFGFSRIQWRPVLLFLLGALPAALLGALLFLELPKEALVRCIGAAIFLLALLLHRRPEMVRPTMPFLVGGGATTGFLSGMAGSAGPLGATVFLSLNLPPGVYVASEAVTALAIHAVKLPVYGHAIPQDARFWILAGVASLGMMLGTWAARHVIERLPVPAFRRYVLALLFLVSLGMILFG